MIEYLHPSNPDDRIFKKALQALESGELIVIPTDTSWQIVASTHSKQGVEGLYRIKREKPDKHFSVLVSSITMAQSLALFSNSIFKIMKKILPGNYTLIFMANNKTAKLLKASKKDHQIGIRIPPVPWVLNFIEYCNHGLISTNITHEMLDLKPDESIYSYLIEEKLADKIKLIFDPGEFEFQGESTIIDFSKENEIEVLRQGIAPTDFL